MTSTPTVAFLRKTIDFGRLNNGDIRFTVATTDIESGDVVLFDTGKGDRIEMDHLLASCGFLPEFAPVEIGGRPARGRRPGGQRPFEPILDEAEGTSDPVFILDLFARDGRTPRRGWNRRWPARTRWSSATRPWQARNLSPLLGPTARGIAAASALPELFPREGRGGPRNPYDFSPSSAQKRWSAGRLDAGGGWTHGESPCEQAIFATVISSS